MTQRDVHNYFKMPQLTSLRSFFIKKKLSMNVDNEDDEISGIHLNQSRR
jgi:hypothetical protein